MRRIFLLHGPAFAFVLAAGPANAAIITNKDNTPVAMTVEINGIKQQITLTPGESYDTKNNVAVVSVGSHTGVSTQGFNTLLIQNGQIGSTTPIAPPATTPITNPLVPPTGNNPPPGNETAPVNPVNPPATPIQPPGVPITPPNTNPPPVQNPVQPINPPTTPPTNPAPAPIAPTPMKR